jgi:hypothetical protein
VQFRVRTDMSNFIDTSTNGTGWFNPDPTNIANFVNNPADSFMVYVGSPTENAYDTNRRWISEILDYAQPRQQLFSVGGKYPAVSPDTLITRAYAGIQPVGGVIRVVFRVKTNRVRADGVVGTTTAFNSKDGAAVLDQVQVDGGTTYGFDAVGDIMPRELAGNIALSGTPWVGTGKPFDADFHVENIASLIYEDLCGAVGSNTRRCNLQGNVVVAGRHDDGEKPSIEIFQGWESPTIDLAVRTAAPGTKNAQGIDRETALRTEAVMDYDLYSGFMSLDESIFWYYGGRFYGPTCTQPVSGNRCWSNTQFYPFIIFNPDPFCFRGSNGGSPDGLNSIGLPIGNMDSLRIKMATISQGWRFGGRTWATRAGPTSTTSGQGFVARSAAASLAVRRSGTSTRTSSRSTRTSSPATTRRSTRRLRSCAPGSTSSRRRTCPACARATRSSRTPLTPADGEHDVACAWTWCSASTGSRQLHGSRATAPLRSSTGPGASVLRHLPGEQRPFGTPGGHGRAWNQNVWNSARMDSADLNVYPIVSRGIGGPLSPVWMGALHELDPNFAALGITHNVCFLIDPNGTTEGSNIVCGGTPPAPYGAVSGTTKEGTKILPDGWFTPGTHVEYFLRKSLLESPATAELLFDTTKVFPQDPVNADFDQERWSSFDVLPDMWKSTRYAGTGLACMLVVDGRRPARIRPGVPRRARFARLRQEQRRDPGLVRPRPEHRPERSGGFRLREPRAVRDELRPLRHPRVGVRRGRPPRRALREQRGRDRAQARHLGTVGGTARDVLHDRALVLGRPQLGHDP